MAVSLLQELARMYKILQALAGWFLLGGMLVSVYDTIIFTNIINNRLY